LTGVAFRLLVGRWSAEDRPSPCRSPLPAVPPFEFSLNPPANYSLPDVQCRLRWRLELFFLGFSPLTPSRYRGQYTPFYLSFPRAKTRSPFFFSHRSSGTTSWHWPRPFLFPAIIRSVTHWLFFLPEQTPQKKDVYPPILFEDRPLIIPPFLSFFQSRFAQFPVDILIVFFFMSRLPGKVYPLPDVVDETGLRDRRALPPPLGFHGRRFYFVVRDFNHTRFFRLRSHGASLPNVPEAIGRLSHGGHTPSPPTPPPPPHPPFLRIHRFSFRFSSFSSVRLSLRNPSPRREQTATATPKVHSPLSSLFPFM